MSLWKAEAAPEMSGRYPARACGSFSRPAAYCARADWKTGSLVSASRYTPTRSSARAGRSAAETASASASVSGFMGSEAEARGLRRVHEGLQHRLEKLGVL